LDLAKVGYRTTCIGLNNTFQLKFLFGIKTVGVADLGGLWALEWIGRFVGVRVGVAYSA